MRPRLEAAGVRPTRHRLALAALLLDGPDRHVTAEEVWDEARASGLAMSLATIYNTLNHFVEFGLLTRTHLSPARALFDTNTTPHHHAYDAATGTVYDLPADAVTTTIADGFLPEGVTVDAVDIVVRLKR
jgi:Fur family iron response transcriptional regulator